MKITIATGPIFPVPAVRGGAVQRLWEGLAREFVKRGHEVTIFAREFPGQPQEETVDGIRYVRRGGYEQSTSIKRDLVQCLIYALKVARHVPPGDVVVTNDFWIPAVLPWLKSSAGKVVVNANRFPKNQYWLYGKVAAFAAASAVVARSIKDQQPDAARRTVVVPNAIDGVFFEGATGRRDNGTTGQPSPRDGLQSNQLIRDDGTTGPNDQKTKGLKDDEQTVRILYVGRVHPEKGLGLLAEALRSMEQGAGSRERGSWECAIVGPVKQSEGGGGEAFAGELKRQVEGLPVRFEAPEYDPAALATIYDAADIFVYPSVAELGESFGIAPLEAMARGVVPVVSGLEVFLEYIDPGLNGVVFDHRSSEAAANLASALRDLIGAADKRRSMGAAARATAERFSPAAIAEKYLQLFEKVVSGSVS